MRRRCLVGHVYFSFFCCCSLSDSIRLYAICATRNEMTGGNIVCVDDSIAAQGLCWWVRDEYGVTDGERAHAMCLTRRSNEGRSQSWLIRVVVIFIELVRYVGVLWLYVAFFSAVVLQLVVHSWWGLRKPVLLMSKSIAFWIDRIVALIDTARINYIRRRHL